MKNYFKRIICFGFTLFCANVFAQNNALTDVLDKKIILLLGEEFYQVHAHARLYGDVPDDSDPNFMKVVKDFEKTTGLYLHIGLYGQDNFKKSNAIKDASENYKKNIFDPRNSKKGGPAIVLEFTSIRTGEKLYTYRDIKKTTVPSSGLSLTKVEVSKDTKNEDLEKLMLKAKETIDAAMPSGKNYANMKDASADYAKAIEALTAYIKTEFTDKGLSKNTVVQDEKGSTGAKESKDPIDAKFDNTGWSTDYVKINNGYPTNIVKVESKAKESLSQETLKEVSETLKPLADADKKTYIYFDYGFAADGKRDEVIVTNSKTSGDGNFIDANNMRDGNVLQILKTWEWKAEDAKAQKLEFVPTYTQQLVMKYGYDAKCIEAINKGLKETDKTMLKNQTEALKFDAKLLVDNLIKCERKECIEKQVEGLTFKSQCTGDCDCNNTTCYSTSYSIVSSKVTPLDKPNRIDIATFPAGYNTKEPADYTTLIQTADFNTGLDYLKQELSNGRPVIVGVHYIKEKEKYNENPATRHYLIVKGMQCLETGVGFNYMDVGRCNEIDGNDANSTLTIDEASSLISGKKKGKPLVKYSITEIRKNNP